MPTNRSSRMTWAGIAAGVALLIAAVTAAVAWRGGPPRSDSSPAVALSHVHGMAVNPADEQLYVATHHGVVRVSDPEAVYVGEGRQDTMGFTVIGPDHFLASGHPAPGAAGPRHLGLIESTDGGRTWRSVSLSGQADFHALRSADGVTYGVDSTSGSLLASSDRLTWQKRSEIDAYDLAVQPGRPDTLLAATERGLQRSNDGGRSWTSAGGPAFVLLHWASRERLHAITADGQILVSTDAATWSRTAGRVPDAPVAFTTHGGVLFVATDDGRILTSADAGATWHPMPTSRS
ncbi:F510_1955 family glycosylhydrolase [Micromonospora thermarum]|uniref:Exo-alpha-sialidase n=1 Tax=Micromonospora thermarum TaxID=2720024 RepID=A0ABX0ZE99_9ACTN|nr:exo-alpha-sialidase [Micromonospora thermarum]NJP35803.1 exo-alpha-sialidase [Micromonospora thermarum]